MSAGTAVREAAAAYASTVMAWRERRLMTRRALANRMGYDRTYVNHIEAGNLPPTREFTRHAEAVLGCEGALWSRWEAYAQARQSQCRAPVRRPANVVPLRELWSPRELGLVLSISPRTLRTWRSVGFGPAWFRVGRHVRYDPAEVRRWLAEECEPDGSRSNPRAVS